MSAPIAPGPAGASLRRWQRFTPAERVMRSAFYVVVLIAIVWSLRSIEIIPEFLYDAPQQTVDLFARMWPIDWAWYPKVVNAALLETLHTATLGTILAVAMASLVALMVARNITRSIILNTIGRFILVATRSVHAMIWALFFVAVFGPGALAGTMSMFRWDINVRESAVLGLVGGGGLGMALDSALSNLYWDQAGLVLFVIFVVVIVAEVVTAWLRSRMI